MALSDLDDVIVLDRLGFATPWPMHAYRYEITSNTNSLMLVLEDKDRAEPGSNGNNHSSWLSRLFGKPPSEHEVSDLLGYCGFWHIAGEAHISTITVHPDWRGHKLGELMLWVMVRQALRQQAEKLTLEVRVSNDVAQNLYRKYAFEIIGRRKGYYRDNHEDAYIMGVEGLNTEAYREQIIRYGQALEEHLVIYDQVPRVESEKR